MRFLSLAVAAGILVSPLAARADLLFDSVDVQVAYPTPTTTFADFGTFVVPDAGSTPDFTFVLNPAQISITAATDLTLPVGTPPDSFDGLEFTDVTTDPGISSVTIDPASTFMGGVITFTSNEVFVNLQGLTLPTGDTLILDLGFGSPASVTPEPSSIALLGTGLLGVAGTMRRRFLRS